MAQENEDGQEKTEDPSGKRLDDARKKGQVARSRELNTFAMTLLGVATLVVMLNYLGDGFRGVTLASFQLDRADVYDASALLRHLIDAIQEALWMLAPFFVVMVVVAIASSVVISGLVFSAESLTFKLSKINPLKGIKRLFSVTVVVELVKSLSKFLLIGGVTVLLLWQNIDRYLGLAAMDLKSAASEMMSLITWSVLLMTSALVVVAAIDVPFQLWNHKRQLRMTKQEMKEEYKNTEGDPKVKGRIRQLQREAAFSRMMQEVPKADVIVTNPTHFAVALRYDQLKMRAPKVVAKGADLVAANIRRVGTHHDVPVIESPLLARAIYFNTEIGDAIPQGLYLAVAKLLAYVYQLRQWQQQGGVIPQAPDEYPIPKDLQTEART